MRRKKAFLETPGPLRALLRAPLPFDDSWPLGPAREDL